MTDPSFELVDEREVYRGYAIRVVEATLTDPDGGSFTRDIVHAPGAVAVVPVTKTARGWDVTLVRQYRAPLGEPLLEIPAGLRDKPGEDVEEVARRELQEEVGLAPGRLTELSSFYNAAGMTDQRTWVFLGEDLSEVEAAADGAEEQWMTVQALDLETAVAMAASGQITDAKTAIGLLLAHRHLTTD